MCHVLMIDSLLTMKIAVFTLGSIAIPDKKIKSYHYQFSCVLRLSNSLVLFLFRYLNWIERYSTMKIGRSVLFE